MKPSAVLPVLLWFVAMIASFQDRSGMCAADDDEFSADRRRMISDQLMGPGRGITNSAVLAAMARVPRHELVPSNWRAHAYQDHPIPIGHGQTISQPFVVAFMSQCLEIKPRARVLEVGTGSGYQAAVLAALGAEVYTIEIVQELADRAARDLKRLGYTNIHVRAGDGYQGWSEAGPFDGVIVTCAPERIPQPLIDQLKDGGRMIIPVGEIYDQNLVLLRKRNGQVERENVLPVRFVPMTGEAQRKQSSPPR